MGVSYAPVTREPPHQKGIWVWPGGRKAATRCLVLAQAAMTRSNGKEGEKMRVETNFFLLDWLCRICNTWRAWASAGFRTQWHDLRLVCKTRLRGETIRTGNLLWVISPPRYRTRFLCRTQNRRTLFSMAKGVAASDASKAIRNLITQRSGVTDWNLILYTHVFSNAQLQMRGCELLQPFSEPKRRKQRYSQTEIASLLIAFDKMCQGSGGAGTPKLDFRAP